MIKEKEISLNNKHVDAIKFIEKEYPETAREFQRIQLDHLFLPAIKDMTEQNIGMT